MVVIVDYNMGNVRSIEYKLRREHVDVKTSADPEDIIAAEQLILPGVGHFSHGITNLRSAGLVDVLNEAVLKRRIPILGICLGMHLMCEHSEEGDVDGLGWIEGRVRRFSAQHNGAQLRVPHVGWNHLQVHADMWSAVADDQRFYFTHSFHLDGVENRDVVCTTHYAYDFVSVIRRGHVFGTQFHPEKSHRRGFDLILDFVKSN